MFYLAFLFFFLIPLYVNRVFMIVATENSFVVNYCAGVLHEMWSSARMFVSREPSRS